MSEITETLDTADKALDFIVEEFLSADRTLPVEAIELARQHRDAVIPRLIRLIEDATELARDGEEIETNGHFFALYLLAEFRAKEALPAIVASFSLSGDGADVLYGDAITETLHRVLAALAHDRIEDVVLPLIRNREANEWVR